MWKQSSEDGTYAIQDDWKSLKEYAMNVIDRSPKFPVGAVVATPGAMKAIEDAGQTPLDYLFRHWSLDQGDLCDEDHAMNNDALENGGRILSSYSTPNGDDVWVITEADRSATTLILKDEY